MQKYTEDYSKMTDEEVVMTYNAVMANAYAGDECALEDEMEKRNLDPDSFQGLTKPHFGRIIIIQTKQKERTCLKKKQ